MEDVVFASEKRKNLLLMLNDGPKETEVILHFLDESRQSLLPQIRILEDHHLVIKDDNDFCLLTTIGKVIVDEMEPLMKTFEVLNTDINYWGTRNLDFVPQNMICRLKELGNLNIWSPSVAEIYEFNKDIIETTAQSKSLISISSFLHPNFFHLFKNLTERKIEVKMIITPELYEKLRLEKHEEFEEILEADRVSFWLYPENVLLPSFIQNDYSSLLIMYNKENIVDHKHLLLSDSTALEWGKDLFQHYMAQSRQITEPTMALIRN